MQAAVNDPSIAILYFLSKYKIEMKRSTRRKSCKRQTRRGGVHSHRRSHARHGSTRRSHVRSARHGSTRRSSRFPVHINGYNSNEAKHMHDAIMKAIREMKIYLKRQHTPVNMDGAVVKASRILEDHGLIDSVALQQLHHYHDAHPGRASDLLLYVLQEDLHHQRLANKLNNRN
jgi:hypothetical protein